MSATETGERMDEKKKEKMFHSCRREFNNVSPDLYFLTFSLSLCAPIRSPLPSSVSFSVGFRWESYTVKCELL